MNCYLQLRYQQSTRFKKIAEKLFIEITKY